MAISLRDLTAKTEFTMREVALDRGFSYLPFSMRELVTPQLQFGQDPFPTGRDGSYPDTRPGDHDGESGDSRPGEQSALASARTRWANWLDDFVEDPATRLEPETRTQLRQAMVNTLDVDGGDAEVRSVGSGHSHSNAAEPSSSFLDLTRMKGTLSHEGWLHVLDPTETDAPASVSPIRSPDGGSGSSIEKSNLVRVRAGTVLKRLNREILPNHGDTGRTPPGKALKNMGSWDGQTLAGAINTGTHGTGIELGSLADVVQSVEIATVPEAKSGVPIVQLYRIEPDGGITDREAFEADTGEHEMELIQDDDVFYSTVVGYGCMGNVVAYTLEVRDAYWLRELTETYRWTGSDRKEGLKSKLQDNPTVKFLAEDPGPVEVRPTRHTSFLLNLPGTQDEKAGGSMVPGTDNPYCLVRRRKEVPASEKPGDWPSGTPFPPERERTGFKDWVQQEFTPYPLGDNPTDQMTGVADLGKFLRERVFTEDYFNTNKSRGNLAPFVEGYFDTASYIALRRRPDAGTIDDPKPPVIDAITAELAVPLSDVTDAVDFIIELVRTTGVGVEGTGYNTFFVAPLGVRFVARSHHHLAPEYHPDPDAAAEPMALLEVPLPAIPYVSHANDAIKPFDPQSTAPAGMPTLTKGQMRDTVAKLSLDRIVRRMIAEFDARPHMGKHFQLSRQDLRELYPRFEGEGGWMETYERFNAFGTFNNAFTDYLDISVEHPGLPDPTRISPPPELPLRDAGGGDDSSTEGTPSTGESTSDGADDAETEASTPGFGLLTAVSALGGYAWWRRRGDDGGETDTEQTDTTEDTEPGTDPGESPGEAPGEAASATEPEDG